MEGGETFFQIKILQKIEIVKLKLIFPFLWWGRPLAKDQKERNRKISSVRAPGESHVMLYI